MFCPFLKEECNAQCPLVEKEKCLLAEYLRQSVQATEAAVGMMAGTLELLKQLDDLPGGLPEQIRDQIDEILRKAGY